VPLFEVKKNKKYSSIMVNKCSCRGCFTNQTGHDQCAVFGLPKEENLRKEWITFINRKDINVESLKYVFVCVRHFEEKFLNRKEKRTRLLMNLQPVPTILSNTQKNLPKSALPTISKPRKPPTQRNQEGDQSKIFFENDIIRDFSDVKESLLLELDPSFSYKRYEDHAVIFAMQSDELSVPKVTHCIRINSDLRVKLFYEGLPLALPKWFYSGRHSKLTSKSMLKNFINYMKCEYENHSSILEEMRRLQFIKSKPIYSADLLRYALLLRYTSFPSYKLLSTEFKLPSASFLRKMTSGTIDTLASAQLLKESGKISNDVILIFDEMYLQKCVEYSGGEMIGADENGVMYKGIVCFMIVGLQSNIPFVIKTTPEKEITGEWLKEELKDCIIKLINCGFNLRGVVSDNHSTNVSAYKKLGYELSQDPDELFITFSGCKIYLFFDSVHLMKNLRNNLLNRKRLLFPNFYFNKFDHEINVIGGEITWNLLHQVSTDII
jgi:hypothetical protein